MKSIILLILFISKTIQATTIDDIAKNREAFISHKVTITGIITRLKEYDKKMDHYFSFYIQSKFVDDYIDVDYFLKRYNKEVNKEFNCKEGQKIILEGHLYVKEKGKKLAEVKVEGFSPVICKDDDEFSTLEEDYTLTKLINVRESLNKKLIKASGFIKDLKISTSKTHKKASFKLIDPGTKLDLKVNMLLSANDQEINELSCEDGRYLVLTGAYSANIKSKTNLGEIDIISKEFIKCTDDKMELSKKDLYKIAQQDKREEYQQLKLLFDKYKKNTKTSKPELNPDEIQGLLKELADSCNKPKNEERIVLLCATITYYVRAMDQRNQVYFKIKMAKENMSDWDQLNKYALKYNHTVLEIIKALYPSGSDYIIGIPERCYPDQQFNPAASNFPYSQLSVSKYAKDNFTAILNKFNDPKLKCGNLMDSIFYIGNMDEDPELEVLQIDLKAPRLIKVIKSDI